MKTLLCFHGSPGSVEDFNQLSKKLPNWNVVAVQRGATPEISDSTVVLGYSWGAVETVRWLSASPKRPEVVIFVSPYLRAKSRGLGGFIFNMVFIGPLAWRLFGNKITESFLQRTTTPNPVTHEYRRTYTRLMTRRILARAFNEKAIPQDTINEALAKTKGVPLLIVYGDSDIVSDAINDSLLIHDARGDSQINEVIVPDAGHALVWTHADELARIIDKYEGS